MRKYKWKYRFEGEVEEQTTNKHYKTMPDAGMQLSREYAPFSLVYLERIEDHWIEVDI